MSNDLVSDMLTRIRNASLARHTYARVHYSKLNVAILNVLEKEGYIQKYQIEEKGIVQKSIKILLRYKGWWIKKPLFSTMKRISKPGQRIFSSYKNFQKKIDILRYQQGIAILSTSSGIMSHVKATKLKKGGEILCFVG
jgi:small subunit ribosomal protein S8